MANSITDSSSSSSSSAGASPDRAVPIAPAAYDDRTNFFRSATPRRIMYFEGDSWIAFEEDVVFSLVEGFRTGRSEVMVSLDSVPHLFDHLSMALIEPESGTRRPIAWFDEEGMCFFPSDHSEGMGLTAPPPLDEAVAERVLVGVPLMKVERGRADFEAVKELFLEGLGTFMMFGTVFGIFQHVPARESGWAWWQAFEESVESTRRQRGAANVRRGWIGCSRERVGEILVNGFGRGGGSSNRAGVICLSSEDHSYMSLKSCDVDDDDLHYIMLCRIIMGNMEEMQPGNQFRPHQENFDSAVDNLEKPKCYMIWSSQTKVIPNRALRTGNRPRSPWMSIPALLSAIANQITPATRAALDLHHDAFRRGEISRHEFIRRMRNLTGDRLLSTTIVTGVVASQEVLEVNSCTDKLSPVYVKGPLSWQINFL
ncbi:Inactive poly [ADP-ribose] polymerase RCD1 [Acorus calamus]|uniref:Inactive poly [ADP-ribose] polymerase RCD1 n=1 Tax=Acorus calamus TaxID=4465 RepID=A0AAV9CHT0_ACOCL|nr:Inactive poly [ADP-ribose] polymerase RCD1 [Acorus calamus]